MEDRCNVCGEPTKRSLTIPSFDGDGKTREMVVSVMCKCQRDDYELRQDEFKRKQEMIEIGRLKKLSLIDDRLSKADLSTFQINDSNSKLHSLINGYIENFDKMYENSQGIVFYGGVGSGKSYAAAVIANELISRHVPVIMTSFVKLLKEAGTFGDSNDKLDRLNNARLLVIDDLGSERGTDYSLEIVYDIIDSRYRSRKPVILTTNLSMKQMKECTDIRYQRIFDRIFEMCFPVAVNGMSWRKKEAADRYYRTKEILGV